MNRKLVGLLAAAAVAAPAAQLFQSYADVPTLLGFERPTDPGFGGAWGFFSLPYLLVLPLYCALSVAVADLWLETQSITSAIAYLGAGLVSGLLYAGGYTWLIGLWTHPSYAWALFFYYALVSGERRHLICDLLAHRAAGPVSGGHVKARFGAMPPSPRSAGLPPASWGKI